MLKKIGAVLLAAGLVLPYSPGLRVITAAGDQDRTSPAVAAGLRRRAADRVFPRHAARGSVAVRRLGVHGGLCGGGRGRGLGSQGGAQGRARGVSLLS